MTKGELKSKLKFLCLHHDPEMTITETMWDKAYHYWEGYKDCFDSIVKFPVQDSFAQNFILEETFRYLLKINQ